MCHGTEMRWHRSVPAHTFLPRESDRSYVKSVKSSFDTPEMGISEFTDSIIYRWEQD